MNTKAAPFAGGRFRVTSPYGDRPELGDFHHGVDLVGLDGDTKVTAVMGGTVIMSRMVTDKSNPTWEWGNYVSVIQDDGYFVYYCHLKSRSVRSGDVVKAGDKLGVMGNTGKSYGAHLHLETRIDATAINAADYLGIPNFTGATVEWKPEKKPTYCDLVVKRCGYEQITIDYINEYKYAEDFWRKAWEQMCLADIGVMCSELGMTYAEALEGLRAILREEIEKRNE